ncbi:MAG: hypothetical protein H0U49_06575 [Parachlamydiaceae bacterium]|nr:hypothetical protein [Parachlamydiaceae bacterium]
MSNVGNSGAPTWDLVSVLGDAYDYLADCSVGKVKDWVGGGIIGQISMAAIGLRAAVGTYVNPLKLVKPLNPLLKNPQKYLLDGIAEFDKYELPYQALLAFERHKHAMPAANFNTLQTHVMEELGAKKAGDLSAVTREVLGNISMEEFFTKDTVDTLSYIEKKQDEILASTFQPLAAEALGVPSWVKLSSYRNSVKCMLQFYSDAVKAPMREAALVDELAGILYKGTTSKNEPALNKGPEANDVKNTPEWKKMVYKEAGVDNAADFLNNILDAETKIYEWAIEKIVDPSKANKEDGATLFAFLKGHIKSSVFKFVNNIANNNVDDLKSNPNGKSSKVLPANAILNFSKLWDSHKNELHTEFAKLREKNLSEKNRLVEYRKIFKGMSTDLIKMLGVNPLEDIDILDSLPDVLKRGISSYLNYNNGSAGLKKRIWDDVENTVIPEELGKFYFTLTQWDADKAANEKIIESRSKHALDSLEGLTRYAVEKIQNLLALDQKKVGNNLKASLIKRYEDAKNTAGDNAVNFLKSKENSSSFQSVLDANLPILAKEEAIANTIEDALHPTVIKLTSEVLGKIGKIEDKEGPTFFREISLKIFQQFVGHMKNINGVRDKIGSGWSNATKVKKSDMVDGILRLKNDESKVKKSDAEILLDENYMVAKKKLYQAKEHLDDLKSIRFKAATTYNSAKSRFSFGKNFVSNYLTDMADEAIKNVKTAKVAVKAAEKEFAEQTKIKHARPMGLKILKLLNVTQENLPLPKDQENLRKIIWDSLTDDILPAALQNMVETITDKESINSGLLSVLEAIKKPMHELEEKDLSEEGVHRRLEAIAGDHTLYPGSSKIAQQILDLAAKGETLANSIRQILVVNPSIDSNAVAVMKHHFKLGCGALPQVRQKFETMLTEVTLAEKKGKEFLDSHGKDFDKACGEGIKEFLNVLPNQSWLRHLNFMKVQRFHDGAAEIGGKMVRESLGEWTVQKVIDKALENVALSKMEGGKWEKNDDGKIVYKKPKPVKEAGYTRDFHLPLTPEAEREYKIKQVLKNKELDNKVQTEMTSAMSYIAKGIAKSVVSSVWQRFLEWIYKAIDYLFSKRAPRLHDALKKAISFCLEKLFAKSVVTFVESVEFVLDKPLTFIAEKLYTSGKAADLIKWTQMSHVHDELVWDAMDAALDKTNKEAIKVGV